jgi:dihydrofolate reductase
MRKLILKMSISLDGFVGGPNGEVDWIFPGYDEGATAWTMDTLWNAGVHAMGSRTFHDMAAHWPTSDEPFAAPMNEIPKVVFSRKGRVAPGDPTQTTRALQDARQVRAATGAQPATPSSDAVSSWAEPQIVSGDLAEEVTRLKQQLGEDILVHGGASLARSLVAQGLVDEFRLLVHPVVLGRGLPLFSDLERPAAITLVSTTTFPSGVVAMVFNPPNRLANH